MTTPNVQVRRATVDDVPRLVKLWETEGMRGDLLEKRFKEFQLAEDANGEVVAAIGFLITDKDGLLHHEAFAHPEQADDIRTQLWNRIQMQAQNHGLVRIWSQSEAPFWHTNGLQEAGEETMKKLPEPFANDNSHWTYIQLRDEEVMPVSLDKEFSMFQEAEREQTQKIFRQARVLKMIAGVLAVIILLLVIVWGVLFLKFKKDRDNRNAAGPVPVLLT